MHIQSMYMCFKYYYQLLLMCTSAVSHLSPSTTIESLGGFFLVLGGIH